MRLERCLNEASTEPGLDQAIAGIHQRFDSNESFTEQLQRQRDAYNSEPRGDGGGPEQ